MKAVSDGNPHTSFFNPVFCSLALVELLAIETSILTKYMHFQLLGQVEGHFLMGYQQKVAITHQRCYIISKHQMIQAPGENTVNCYLDVCSLFKAHCGSLQSIRVHPATAKM